MQKAKEDWNLLELIAPGAGVCVGSETETAIAIVNNFHIHSMKVANFTYKSYNKVAGMCELFASSPAVHPSRSITPQYLYRHYNLFLAVL
jgi:hypothetical protein